MERGCKVFERLYGGYEIIKGRYHNVRSGKKIEKKTMRYLSVMWNRMQRYERWRDCGLELYVTVGIDGSLFH